MYEGVGLLFSLSLLFVSPLSPFAFLVFLLVLVSSVLPCFCLPLFLFFPSCALRVLFLSFVVLSLFFVLFCGLPSSSLLLFLLPFSLVVLSFGLLVSH